MVKSRRVLATCLQSSPKYDVDLSTTRGGPFFFRFNTGFESSNIRKSENHSTNSASWNCLFWNSLKNPAGIGMLLSEGSCLFRDIIKEWQSRYVMVWFEGFFASVSVCVRNQKSWWEANGTIESEALGSFRCRSLQLHRGPRSWPVHRRRLRTGCARLQLRGSCVRQQLRGHAAGRSIFLSELKEEELLRVEIS